MVLTSSRSWASLVLLVGTIGTAPERQVRYEIEILPVPSGCQARSRSMGWGSRAA